MKVAVVGMGKIGLPLALQYASKGHTVIGIDVNEETVTKINSSEEPFPGEFGLAASLKNCVHSGLLRATSSYKQAIPTANVVVVVVPLFVDKKKQADFVSMDSATRSIAQNLTESTLIIYETTLPIGTTRNRWKPMIESLSGLREGTHFHLVFSPERVFTGRVFEDLRKYPKLVGGLSREGAALAVDFYEAALDFDERDDLGTPNGVWDLGSAEAAEMAKLAETTYRDVNIALANQFAVHAEEVGVDVYKVIEACNSQPYSHIHRPGISVGGHCIPIYPQLYLSTDTTRGVVAASREVNSKMPALVASKLVARGLSLKGKNILILGLAYRSGVKEDAFSGFYPLAEELEKEGATVYVIDPLYSEKELTSRGLRPMRPGARLFALILHTEHQEFRSLSTRDFPGLRIVFDGRDFLSITDWEGVDFITLGRGKSSTQEFSQ